MVGNSIFSTSSLGVSGNGIVLVDNSINQSTLSAAAGIAVLGIGNVLQGSTTSRGFQGSGIFVENTIQNNASFGLELTDGGYGLNIINDNNGGAETQVSGGASTDQISFNICQVDFTCP